MGALEKSNDRERSLANDIATASLPFGLKELPGFSGDTNEMMINLDIGR